MRDPALLKLWGGRAQRPGQLTAPVAATGWLTEPVTPSEGQDPSPLLRSVNTHMHTHKPHQDLGQSLEPAGQEEQTWSQPYFIQK